MHAFLRNKNGATAVTTALTAVVLVGFAGLAVDVGNVYLNTRRLQGIADLAAISAASDLPRARERAGEAVRLNNWPGNVRISTDTGAYRPNPDVPAARRFSADGAGRNAARVQLRADTPLYFAAMFVPEGRMSFTREAVAAQSRLAAFSVGTRLLSLDGGALNALLSGLTGSNVSLSVMDYRNLASADVDLFDYLDALRTRVDLEAASYDEALDARVRPGDALGAVTDVLAQHQHPGAPAMDRLARSATGLGSVDGLSDLIDVGPYGSQDINMTAESARVRVNALDLATAVLELANGERQVQLNLASGVPGLATTQVWLAIGERPNNSPWLSVTDDRDVIVRTAQARLYVETRVGAGGLLGSVRVPILVELASAEARLRDVECGDDPSRHSVTLEASPSIGMLALADIDRTRLNNFRQDLTLRPARLVDLALLKVDGAARIDVGGDAWRSVRFSGDDIAQGRVRSVATRDAANATVSSLLGNTNVTVRPLGLSTGPVTAALRPALATAASGLDPLINGLTDLLGIKLGEADLRVTGVRCGAAALVL
ncbi:transmembrane protein [alpha proteobacterium U9-1i]|nr:transmembrane protein [alpha proteobacterium U9-1i]